MAREKFDRPERIQFSEHEAELATLAVRAGQMRTMEGEHNDPIYPTSSFVFSSAREAAAVFAGDEEGNVYGRFTNPTVHAFERRIAALEGAERAVATASGMAAILSAVLSLLKHGDHVVCSRSVFGSTMALFEKYISRCGITTTFVNPVDIDAWRDAVKPETKMLFLETPSNPLAELTDLKALAQIARENEAYLTVDNCFATPILQRPLELGADVVIHSATKYLDGQGRCVGGVVLGSHALMEEVFGFIRTGGACMSPFNAWVFHKGLETLKLRIDAHCKNAMELASWLEQQAGVERVHYSGLSSHPQHALAAEQMSGFGGVFSFEVAGGRDGAWRFIDATQFMSITGNLGDVKTTITHPATTTHGKMSAEARATAGIGDNLIRISAGIEDIEDLRADLQRGLAAL